MTEHLPPAHTGLRHVALWVDDLEACEAFYVGLLNMAVEWRPDEDNLYLTSGADNLALHRRTDPSPASPEPEARPPIERLDHIGFILARASDVDAWHTFLVSHNVNIAQTPKTHRDGARSFYCRDPAGTLVQMIYHPPLAS